MANGKPGRPAGRIYDAEVEVWMTGGTLRAFQDIADARGRPRSELLREALLRYLHERDQLPGDLPAADRAAVAA